MSDVLGSAAWSGDCGRWRYGQIGGTSAPLDGSFLLLGESTTLPGNLHARPPVQHMITIAPTRSGKGVSLIVPNLLTYKGAVFVIDPKGENAWITASRRRALGQKTVILDPWGEVNRRYGSFAGGEGEESVARFNPLSILNPGSDEYVDDLAYLADAIIVSQSSRDPHWDDSARELVAGLIAFVVESPAYRAEASLALVRGLLSLPGPELRVAIKDAQALGPGSIARAKLSRFDADTPEISSVMSTARTQTAFLDSDVLARNMEASDFSFEELCQGNISIYLVLPPDKLETYSRWLRLMVSMAIRAVARGGSVSAPSRGGGSQGRLPALFMLDEFGTIGKLNAVAHAYGLMAGLGMILWAFAQDLNQLKRDYPEHWETFIGNSQAVTCFGVMDNFTADYISKMLGISTVEHKNVSTSTSHSYSSGAESHSVSTGHSTQTMARPLMQPDEIRGLDRRVCLIISRDQPIFSQRIVYHEDWDLLHWAREDPHHLRTENVRWVALQRRLREMGSVAGVLGATDFRFKVKRRLFRGWKVTSGDGTWSHTFANANDLWRWAYVLAIDGKNLAKALPSGST